MQNLTVEYNVIMSKKSTVHDSKCQGTCTSHNFTDTPLFRYKVLWLKMSICIDNTWLHLHNVIFGGIFYVAN